METPSLGWLLGVADEGKLADVAGAEVDLSRPLSPETLGKADGVVAGIVNVGGAPVAVFAQEPSYKGGSMGLEHTKRLEKLVTIAVERNLPVVGFYDSGGVRAQEGGNSLEEASALVGKLLRARESVPVVSAVMGTVSGAATYSAFMGHAVIMVKGKGRAFVWGPGVAKAETDEEVGAEELGGWKVQAGNGEATHVVESEAECLLLVKKLLARFGGRGAASRPEESATRPIEPIETTFDPGSFIEFRGTFGPSVVTGLALLERRTVGVVASNKEVRRGFLDVDACRKMARFVSMCNSLRIPLVTLLDCPGVYPGSEQEAAGIIAASGEAIKEYSSDRCAKVTVITGDAYGGAFVGFASRALGSKKVFAYPDARISVLSLPAYVEIFLKRKLDALKDEERRAELERASGEFSKLMDPAIGVSKGYVDEVIEPSQTRQKLISAFAEARGP
jgi:propionyl-CoA carboxylase beta chain